MSSSAAPIRTINQELVRFLLARVDEDVAEIKRLANQAGGAAEGGVGSVARLQADAAAKRRLVGALQQLIVLRDQPFERAVRDQAGQMLRVLAVPYAAHASYRHEWRPYGSH